MWTFRSWRCHRRLKIARALATDCCHSVFSPRRISFHLTPRSGKKRRRRKKKKKKLFSVVSLYRRCCSVFVVNVSSSRAFFDVPWSAIPSVRGIPRRRFSGEEKRKCRGGEGEKKKKKLQKSLTWTTPDYFCARRKIQHETVHVAHAAPPPGRCIKECFFAGAKAPSRVLKDERLPSGEGVLCKATLNASRPP